MLHTGMREFGHENTIMKGLKSEENSGSIGSLKKKSVQRGMNKHFFSNTVMVTRIKLSQEVMVK